VIVRKFRAFASSFSRNPLFDRADPAILAFFYDSMFRHCTDVAAAGELEPLTQWAFERPLPGAPLPTSILKKLVISEN